jgi:hypothetical protein
MRLRSSGSIDSGYESVESILFAMHRSLVSFLKFSASRMEEDMRQRELDRQERTRQFELKLKMMDHIAEERRLEAEERRRDAEERRREWQLQHQQMTSLLTVLLSKKE